MSSNGSWGRRFLVFGKNYLQVRQNCTLCVRMRCLIELFFLWIFWVSSLFSDCEQNILHHWRKNFGKVVKGAFYLNNKFFEESLFSEDNKDFYKFFEIWWKICGLLSESVPPDLKNCFLHSFGGSSSIILSFSSRKLTPTNGLWGNLFGMFSFFLTGWSKLFPLCPEDIFAEIIFFFTTSSKFSVVFRLWRKHFGLLAKKILLGWQNSFQVSRGYFWKSLFLKTYSLKCFFIFGLRAQFFWTFSENIAIGLWKLHSMCPVEVFDWTVFSTKIYE